MINGVVTSGHVRHVADGHGKRLVSAAARQHVVRGGLGKVADVPGAQKAVRADRHKLVRSGRAVHEERVHRMLVAAARHGALLAGGAAAEAHVPHDDLGGGEWRGDYMGLSTHLS